MPERRLPVPPLERDAVERWVTEHLGDLAREDSVRGSGRFRGGQTAADAALATLDLRGYAAKRNQVEPPSARGASAVSPYIRHGLIGLAKVWHHAGQAPPRDAVKYRDELLWQEYARHVYARVGAANRRPLRREPARAAAPWGLDRPWPEEMECMRRTTEELRADGWLVNQTRMWLSSQWTIRAGRNWQTGEDVFFAHLLDGSRAANRLGWQWTIGAGTGRPYGFARWQVEKRAPAYCRDCALSRNCPIEDFPETGPQADAPGAEQLAAMPGAGAAAAGPAAPDRRRAPRAVWLTAESLGDADPALRAHPELPVVFVFDERLLAQLRLSGKRLVFLAETLADLGQRRELEVLRGDPAAVAAAREVAVTYAPVPGFRAKLDRVAPAELHPWPWLAAPHDGPHGSYSAWRRRVRVPSTSSVEAAMT